MEHLGSSGSQGNQEEAQKVEIEIQEEEMEVIEMKIEIQKTEIEIQEEVLEIDVLKEIIQDMEIEVLKEVDPDDYKYKDMLIKEMI